MAQSLSWSDIDAWRRVTGNVPRDWELRALLALDNERTSWLRKPASERQKMVPATAENLVKVFRAFATGNPKRQVRKK